MSKSHDQLATVKLTAANTKAVDRRAKVEAKIFKIKVSRATMANKAVAVGIKHLNGGKV